MYESYFGLSDKPFKLSPEPKFFFESPHHRKAVSYLRYGLSQGEGFIVVTGPIGTGKTTIARNLIASLDDSIIAAQIATTRLTPDELVKLVAAQFDISVEGLSKADVLKRLELYLFNLHRQGRRALLIIDEAQNLPSETVEELRMLSNFQLDDRPLIQSFLLGQEELKPIIELPEMEQFRQRIIASCHLQPLDEDETRGYILHRLKQVGWNGRPKLEPEIFEKVVSHTAGIPRKINIFMDRLFLFAYMESLDTINLKHVESVMNEMNSELSGALQGILTNDGQVNDKLLDSRLDRVDMIDVDKAHKVLMDISTILDGVIHRKTQTIRYLDKLIREKRKVLSAPDERGHEDRLVEKSWVKQLMKEREL